MIIDAHNHADWLGHSLDKTIRNMDACGIDRAWMLTWECPVHEYAPANGPYINVDHERGGGPISFARVLSYAERRPDRFTLGFCPDPRQPYALDRLRAAAETYGVKVCGEWKLRMMFDNPDTIRMFHLAGELGMPVVLHLDYPIPQKDVYPHLDYWYGGDILALERALALCPDTNFLGHAPGFWAHISGDGRHLTESYPKGPVLPGGEIGRLLERWPNLYCDLSGASGKNALERDREHAVKFLTKWQDRVVYGRDVFHNHLRELLDGLNLPKDILEKIYSRNALKLLGEAEAASP